jgi:hypothetical protein
MESFNKGTKAIAEYVAEATRHEPSH